MKEGCSVDNSAEKLLLKSENTSSSVPNWTKLYFYQKKKVFFAHNVELDV